MWGTRKNAYIVQPSCAETHFCPRFYDVFEVFETGSKPRIFTMVLKGPKKLKNTFKITKMTPSVSTLVFCLGNFAFFVKKTIFQDLS